MVIVMLVMAKFDQMTTISVGRCDWVDIHKDTRRKEEEGSRWMHIRSSLNHRQEEQFTNLQEKQQDKEELKNCRVM